MKQKRRQLGWKVYPSLPSRRPSADRRTLPLNMGNRPFFDFFDFFRVKKNDRQKTTFFRTFLRFWLAPASIFSRFGRQNGSPEAAFSVFFSKTAILSKSRSRLGNNKIFEGRTLRKSVRRATPNGDRNKKRQNPLLAACPHALFRIRARFWWILGSLPGPKIVPKLIPKPR